MSNEEYSLIVSFPDQSESFVLGVEAGMLWQRLEQGEEKIEATTHVENREVITRMASARHYVTERTPTTVQGWDETVLHRYYPKKTLRIIQGGLGVPK